MPNKPDIYKRILNLRIDRETYEKVRKLARERKCTMSDIVLRWVVEGTINVNLTPEDHEEIARQIREAAAKRG